MRSTPTIANVFGPLRKAVFRATRILAGIVPGGRILAFGSGTAEIGAVLIINLERQPQRLRRTLRELNRFRTSEGLHLTSISRRLPAIDARDGREVASTADVDPTYRIADQLFVQPDTRLQECFDMVMPVKMTRQEVAVARSHIEAWKAIVAGEQQHVLVLEDDVWFTRGAAEAIDRGWRAAWEGPEGREGPQLLYLSYEDAGGTATRTHISDDLFRAIRGLWLLSGYVLSRRGAEALLRSMPVVGPVDMWINYHLESLGAQALTSPAILQRRDGNSDNSHSIMPYLARAGVIDANATAVPARASAGPVLAWTIKGQREGLAMALSMLGLRVRVFDGKEAALEKDDLFDLLTTFDALVDTPLSNAAMAAAIACNETKFVLESDDCLNRDTRNFLSPTRTVTLSGRQPTNGAWQALCAMLNLIPPPHDFPVGPPRQWRLFRDDRPAPAGSSLGAAIQAHRTDDSAWAMIPGADWPLRTKTAHRIPPAEGCVVHAGMTTPPTNFRGSVETFPGNLAAFSRDALSYGPVGAQLTVNKTSTGSRTYRSGAFASIYSFGHGRFEAEIKAAKGCGLVTGFFLHRADPRQEIDVELTGDRQTQMLVNVYFNPGDEGAAIGYGYRGSPCRIELGFDATSDFHQYAIDWQPDNITWIVDGRIVHSRRSWDPTPIPHLPMRLHANLWTPRSKELAGSIDDGVLPATSVFRNIKIWN
ncbi:family 16 glycosylhydrolase [Rhizobium laguerreae]|uniref:family 16 glycosylhydrolase n=1 Tax=Rhizobium laguerreae TaxID=1076926 RepID=UPI001478CCC2|nr:family 16 glycosylhydrolase [Rhizobium laguerreae]NNH55507.1 family 16 glycosylhydrolase [Rhizobium laguerreae]